MQNELQRRIDSAFAGRRDPVKDYQQACLSVKRTHEAFKNSKDKRLQQPTQSASDSYARALNELDLCTRVLEIFSALEKAS